LNKSCTEKLNIFLCPVHFSVCMTVYKIIKQKGCSVIEFLDIIQSCFF
jgi:hypothetical protein